MDLWFLGFGVGDTVGTVSPKPAFFRGSMALQKYIRKHGSDNRGFVNDESDGIGLRSQQCLKFDEMLRETELFEGSYCECLGRDGSSFVCWINQ